MGVAVKFARQRPIKNRLLFENGDPFCVELRIRSNYSGPFTQIVRFVSIAMNR